SLWMVLMDATMDGFEKVIVLILHLEVQKLCQPPLKFFKYLCCNSINYVE
ncbi:Protein O-linked-mannose beta-1,2-N-acetylglucosaminyltransferase 1, partial [Araneus ventricosus]